MTHATPPVRPLAVPTAENTRQANLSGALCAMGAMVFFSTNDVGIKFLSGDYALHQIVLIRSIVGMIVFALVLVPLSGGLRVIRTKRLRLHLLRGVCVVFANLCFFLSLASIPLADAVAVLFVSPLLIALASILFLRERVDPLRWVAIGTGFIGVLIIVRPGSAGFQPANLLPVLAACGYAALHTFTRHMRDTESATTMAFYIQLTFIIASGLIGIALGDGRFAGLGHPSIEFLLRAWTWPSGFDWLILLLVGAGSVAGGWLVSQAYRLSEAAFAATFEYIAMPMAVFWGFTIFGDIPDAYGWLGMTLILSGGLGLLWHEAVRGRRPPAVRR